MDLNPGSGHNANINAIADAGITLGCSDTTHYCPNDFVTREQMASFLARTAGLGSNAPIANAKTAQTANKLATNPTGAKTFAANELSRVAFAGVTDGTTITFNAGLNNFQPLTSLSIIAPQAGYVLVTSAATPYTTGTSGCPCSTGARIRHDTGNTAIFSNNVTLANAAASIVSNGTVSSTWVFPVNAGANTFSLEGSVFSGTATINFNRYRLTALFVPFSGTGVAP